MEADERLNKSEVTVKAGRLLGFQEERREGSGRGSRKTSPNKKDINMEGDEIKTDSNIAMEGKAFHG